MSYRLFIQVRLVLEQACMNKKIHCYIIIFLSVISLHSLASEANFSQLDKITEQSLLFLNQQQFKEDTEFYTRGEWSAQMKSYGLPALVGLGRMWGRRSEEPTAFVTSTIVNSLSEAYLLNPNLNVIPNIIQNAIPSLDGYRENDVFHYYPTITYKGKLIHGPRDPHYVPRSMLQMAIIPPDADTTSVSFTALAYVNLIHDNQALASYKLPNGTLEAFSTFRDIKRSPHLYNRNHGKVKKTGAFLTWLWDEDEKTSSFFRSMNDKPNKGYRIIFGRNDVDCVVNANVMRLLTITNNQHLDGYENSCELLNSAIIESRMKTCGVYYPNSYKPLQAISNVYKAGASCLEKSREKAINFILEQQNSDGSWKNEPGHGREDSVQSTAWALGALLNYININDRRFIQRVEKAVQFLLSKSKSNNENLTYWKGEVFFSGSAAARNTLLWRSNAYTTATVFLSLVKAKAYLQYSTTQLEEKIIVSEPRTNTLPILNNQIESQL